jgi:hypothetical protein
MIAVGYDDSLFLFLAIAGIMAVGGIINWFKAYNDRHGL